MTLAYARKDIDTMCERFFDVSSLDESDPDGFREGLKHLSERWYSSDRGVVVQRLHQISEIDEHLPRAKSLGYQNIHIVYRGVVATPGRGMPESVDQPRAEATE